MSKDSVNLITAYIEANGGKPGAALGALNAKLGATYDLSRMGQWRRGERPTPNAVERTMRAAVLTYQLGAERAAELAPMLETSYCPDIELDITASAELVKNGPSTRRH